MKSNLFWPMMLAGAVVLPMLMSHDGDRAQHTAGPVQDSGYSANLQSLANQDGYVFSTASAGSANSPMLPNATTAPPATFSGAPPSPSIVDFGGRESVILPGDQYGPDLNAAPMVFVPVTDFGQVFRFDATNEWVRSRWDRVSVFDDFDGLKAYRCDFVSGVNRSDIHGCITYYFNRKQTVEKISFRGWTGDAQPFVAFCSREFELQRRDSSALGLYLRKSWGQITGAMILQSPAVIRRENPNQSVAIFLEVCSPSASTGLSQVMQDAIEALK